MEVVKEEFVKNKKVLLRYDMDVALSSSGDKIAVAEDFKLRAGLSTLKLCLENASKVIIIGHLGRPFETADEEKHGKPADLSAKPIRKWMEEALGQVVDFAETLEQAANSKAKLVLLDNTRFFHGEVPGAEYHATCISKTCDIDFARQLASLGECYVNEAFSSYNPAASTTIVPSLMPHAAGLHFKEEVETLSEIRDNPKKPLIVIMGGAKVKDKLPVIEAMAKEADAILVGGKLVHEIREQSLNLPSNVLVARLKEDGFDIAPETTASWANLIMNAAMIVWNGPLGKFEDPKNEQSANIADKVLSSSAKIIIGGGDTVSLLGSLGILGEFEKKGFVSVGGGAMLKFLAEGTLETIKALA